MANQRYVNTNIISGHEDTTACASEIRNGFKETEDWPTLRPFKIDDQFLKKVKIVMFYCFSHLFKIEDMQALSSPSLFVSGLAMVMTMIVCYVFHNHIMTQ